MELPFASLHQVCTPLLGYLEAIPPPREALGTAFGLRGGAPPDRFLVGVAVLSLLSESGHIKPLLCLVDDAHWLDQASAQALALAARRLDQDATAVLFASRASDGSGLHAGLPELVLAGLSHADALKLLRSEIPGRLDEKVAEGRGGGASATPWPRSILAGRPVRRTERAALPSAPTPCRA